MMNNKTLSAKEMEKAVEDVLAIIAAKGTKIEKTAIEEAPKGHIVTYDGYGTVIEVDGVRTHQAKKKKTTRVRNVKDIFRDTMTEACEEFLKGSAAFAGKVHYTSKDGVIIRMADADYCVKATGHAKAEYDPSEEGFKPSKSFATRGTAVNHAPSIAKMIAEAIENSNPIFEIKNENQNSNPKLVEAKSSGVRVHNAGSEVTIKITKKRDRVLIEG